MPITKGREYEIIKYENYEIIKKYTYCIDPLPSSEHYDRIT